MAEVGEETYQMVMRRGLCKMEKHRAAAAAAAGTAAPNEMRQMRTPHGMPATVIQLAAEISTAAVALAANVTADRVSDLAAGLTVGLAADIAGTPSLAADRAAGLAVDLEAARAPDLACSSAARLSAGRSSEVGARGVTSASPEKTIVEPIDQLQCRLGRAGWRASEETQE